MREKQKGYNVVQFVTKFLNQGWTKSMLHAAELRKHGTVDSSGRQRIAHSSENIDVIESLVLNQDNMNRPVKLNVGIIF